MAKEGTLSRANLGINPNLCTPGQAERNFANIRDNLLNFQTQLGDVNQLFSGIQRPPTVPSDGIPGLSDLLQQMLTDIQFLKDNIGGGGGSGVAAYGGLLLDSSYEVSLPSAAAVAGEVEFDVAAPLLGVTATTGSGAKLTVPSDGDYLVTFMLFAEEEADTTVSRRFGILLEVYVNGVAAVGFSRSRGSTVFSGETSNTGVTVQAGGSLILELDAGDEIELHYSLGRNLNSLTFGVGTPGNVAEGAAGANSRGQLSGGQLNVVKLN